MSPLALSLRLLQAQPDERLVALARGGHEPAFEALVRRYRRQLLAYCRKLAAPDASAEDILQQALMQAWRALAGGAEVHDARAWLYRIVHNAAVSATRKAGEASAQLSQNVIAVEVEQVVEQRLAAREALAGLAALPELQRQVMLGTAVEGRSHEEVAASLGITSGSVRGLLYRARSTLRAAAAAVVPGPMIEWAIRQQQAGRGGASGMVEAIAGGSSAGVGGAMLKGGAVVTLAGALAGTATMVVTHRSHIRLPPARAAVMHTAAPKRRIAALTSVPAAADAPAPEGTAGSMVGARLEPVRLLGSDRHAGSPSQTRTIDATHPLARAGGISDRSGSDRSSGSDRGSNQIGSGRGNGAAPSDSHGTASSGGGDHSGGGTSSTGSGDGATAASASEGDGAAGSLAVSGDASTGSPGTSTTTTQSSQPALSPPTTGSDLTGSEYEIANRGSGS